jgi:hypothetical protein
MKIQLILISILLFFSIGLCGQIDNTIDKGTGILYFSGIPGTTPDTTASSYEAEIAFNTINGEMFFYDRDSTSWKRLTGIEKGFGDPTADPGIYAKSYVNLTDGSFWRWNGAIWVNAFASGGGGISDGDKGDITVSGSGTVWTIDNEAVTTEKLESGESSPIANQFYGTNNIGTKGFHSIDTINTIGKVYRTASDSMFLQAPTVWISNNTQEVLSIDMDGVKILNSVQDNGATVLYGKDPLSSEIVEVNDLTGFTGVGGGGGKFVDGTDPNDAVYTTGSVGIGTTAPDASSYFDVVGTAKGSRPVPNMTEAQRDVINGGTFVEGLQVYNTDTKAFNYYDGTSWVAVVTDADSYTHTFATGDWGGVSGAYTLTITAATHGLGTTLGADVKSHNMYSDDGTSVISETSTTVAINKTTGDITLTSSSPTTFNGKLVINK